MRADFRAVLLDARPRRLGRAARPRPTRASRPSTRCRSSWTTRTCAPAARLRPGAPAREHGSFEQVGWVLAGMERDQVPEELRSSSVTDTDELLADAGYTARRDRRPAREGNRRVTDVAGGLPPEIEALIGKVQYEEIAEFPVERSYIWTTCASVENGNPLYWDDDGRRGAHRRPDRAADDALGVVPGPPVDPLAPRRGPVAPGRTSTSRRSSACRRRSSPTTRWRSSSRSGPATSCAPTRSCARSATRRPPSSGPGASGSSTSRRFNQRDELVGVDTYTSFGYRRPNS